MSKRAEKRALEAIPNVAGPYDVMSNADKRKVFVRGYEQAEKDLALTWEDMKLIDGLITEMAFSEPNDSMEWYQELANRFNEQIKK